MNIKLCNIKLPAILLGVFAAPLFAAGGAYLGVDFSADPLPALLSKHLKLEGGVLIRNIAIDSPADNAGLERDDIIVKLNNQPLLSSADLIKSVQGAGTGSDVMLTVIQSGTVRDITVSLGSRPASISWKYLPEVSASQIWRPGRVFHRGEPGQQWLEMEIGKLPQAAISKLSISQIYQYQHGYGSEAFTVVIQGKPDDADTPICVKSGQTEYAATIGTLERIPDVYRPAVAEDIEKSKDHTIDINADIDIPDFFNADPNNIKMIFSSSGSGGVIPSIAEAIKQLPQSGNLDVTVLEKEIGNLQIRITDMEKDLRDMLEQSKKKSTDDKDDHI